jgi:hypothetical protein
MKKIKKDKKPKIKIPKPIKKEKVKPEFIITISFDDLIIEL